MADPRFYDRAKPLRLDWLAAAIGAAVTPTADNATLIEDVASAERAGPRDLCYATTSKAVAAVRSGSAGVVVTTASMADQIGRANVLIHTDPMTAFAKAAHLLFPDVGRRFTSSAAAIDPSARIGADVKMEHGVTIGPGVEIGRGSYLSAYAVVGHGVAIGRDCFIGPHASILYSLLGDRVIIHGGARLGSDGFGYASSAAGHLKIPQLGRVIVQDDVEIGANTTIDRGALADTVIGEGAKIDNLVQIGHNCVIGRRAILVSQVGLSGSVTIGDGVVLAGKAGVADHITIGTGARVAAKSGVTKDLAGGQDYGGIPAQPVAQWRREMVALRRLAKETRRRDE